MKLMLIRLSLSVLCFLTVDLKEGDNQIRIRANGVIMMDHVNVHHVGQE